MQVAGPEIERDSLADIAECATKRWRRLGLGVGMHLRGHAASNADLRPQSATGVAGTDGPGIVLVPNILCEL
jgi:hypothetical protein